VLIDELWDGSLKQYTPNGPVVTVPARDMCAFCDAASAEGIRQLRKVAQQTTRAGRGWSATIAGAQGRELAGIHRSRQTRAGSLEFKL